ncbi:hypothetical protein CHH83_20955 [Bacillus sp. 7586-K]|nr:hypothetical protein CHH83_20955 [Bacillus sp. 7586-K]
MTTKVEEAIIEKGLRKGWVAEKAGISPGSLSKICSGETKDPKTSVSLAIAKVLNMSVEELFGDLVKDRR